MQRIVRTVQENYVFEDDFSPSTSSDSEDKPKQQIVEQNFSVNMSNRSVKKKEVELNPKYKALFVETQIEKDSNKVRFPEIVKRALQIEKVQRQ